MATCGSLEIKTAATAAVLWLASLFTFSFAHVSAACSGSNGTNFIVAATALGVGSIGAGMLSDRVGRSATVRILFALGTVACIATAAIHPDDRNAVLVFAAAAAAAAGGCHVSSELMLEQVPEKFRALVLLSSPALFFPVGAVQYLFEQIGWYSSATIVTFFVMLAGVALIKLPESRLYESARASRDLLHPPTPRRGRGDRHMTDSSSAVTAVDLDSSFVGRLQAQAGCFGAGSQEGGRPFRDGPCSRLFVLTSILWLLFTASYYLTSLTFLLPSAPGPDGAIERSAMCAKAGPRTPRAIIPADQDQGPAQASQCAALPTFFSGAHLVGAEVLSIVLVAALANTERLGRRLTLALSFGLAAVACVTAAGTMPAFGCNGTALRAALEFFVRVCIAACAQALFLYTLEVCATSVRSTIIGTCVGVFRLGGLLTLANNLASGAETRLQWTVYALQHAWSAVLGGDGSGMSHGTATTVVLAAAANACLVSACLSFLLPIEPRTKLLRDVPGQPFTESRVTDSAGSDTSTRVDGAGAHDHDHDQDGRTTSGLCGAGFGRALAAVLSGAGNSLGYGNTAYGRVSASDDSHSSDGDAPDEQGGGVRADRARDGRPAGQGSDSADGFSDDGDENDALDPSGFPAVFGARGKGYRAVDGRGDRPLGSGPGRPSTGPSTMSGSGKDVELELAVLGPQGGSDGPSRPSDPPGSAVVTVKPCHEKRALRWFPRHSPKSLAGQGQHRDSMVSHGHGVPLAHSSAVDVGAGTGLVPHHEATRRQRFAAATAAADVPAVPPGYTALPLRQAVEKAETERDPAVAAWLSAQLSFLATSMVLEGLEDVLDAELSGLDTAGLDRDGLKQEATRFRLLEKMWAKELR